MKRSLLTLALLYCTLCSFAQNEKGTKAPDFELTDIAGNTITSASTEGKVVVLNFWYIGCKPCLQEIPELNEVYEKYHENPDVVFASVTLDKLEMVRKNQDTYNIRYPVVVNGKPTARLFEVEAYTTNIVIDKSGNFHFSFTGGFEGIGNIISKAIQTAL